MKLAYLLKITADLSEASLQDAWEQAYKPNSWSLVVGAKDVSTARSLTLNGVKVPFIWVNPDWDHEWMLQSRYINIFCESI